MDRHIRLFDFGTNKKRVLRPWKEYLNYCNASLEEKDFIVETDQFGFLKSNKDINSNPRNIFCIGDSVLENIFVESELRTSSVIQRYLDAKGYEFNIINASFSGSTTMDLYNIFVNKCLRFKPVAIVLMSGMSDLTTIAQGMSLWDASVEHSDGSTPHANPSQASCGENVPVGDLNLKDRLLFLDLFRSTCQVANIKLFVATWGYTNKMSDCFALSNLSHINCEFVSQARLVNAQTRDFAKKTGISLCDIEPETRNMDDLFYDGLHPNKHGCEVIGKNISETISHAFCDAPRTGVYIRKSDDYSRE